MMTGPSHLKQGEKGKIIGRIATVSRTGRAVETIEVLSNDPKRPRITLTLRAQIFPGTPP
jgi:hypothetical protein